MPDGVRECVDLAWWGTAWLRGDVSPDDLFDAVPGASALLGDLAAWRRAGCRGLGLAVVLPGEPLGVNGAGDFTDRVVEAGAGVVALGVGRGVVPNATGWDVLDALRGPVPDLGEADRGMRTALTTAADRLAALDVARWRPEIADVLMNLRHRPEIGGPPGIDPRCLLLAGRSLQLLAITALGTHDRGAAVSASEMALRQQPLDSLAVAAWRGLVAACSPDAWPDAPAGPARG